MRFSMVHSSPKQRKSRVRQSQVCYLHTTHFGALNIFVRAYVVCRSWTGNSNTCYRLTLCTCNKGLWYTEVLECHSEICCKVAQFSKTYHLTVLLFFCIFRYTPVAGITSQPRLLPHQFRAWSWNKWWRWQFIIIWYRHKCYRTLSRYSRSRVGVWDPDRQFSH